MARKVFISFLGMGGKDGYTPVVYKQNNKVTYQKREFVQTAILELHPHTEIEKIILLTTKESEEKHKQKLKQELKSIGVDEVKYHEIKDISSDLTQIDAAWEWFGQLQGAIAKDDILILDVTHGFRIIPVVFSAAIGYLKRAKNVRIESVLYGVYDAKEEEKPIVDVKDFYTINDWAEGVGRLVDDADASFLKKVAEKEKGAGFSGLNNSELLKHIENLTNSFRNVELHKIENNARIALDAVQKAIITAKPLEKQILEMIVEKFVPLISAQPADGKYSNEYLSLQIKLIELLAQHGLYMQCFTAMREWLGSLGLAILGKKIVGNKKEGNIDEQSRSFAEIFIKMLQNNREKWVFDERQIKKKDELLPAYNSLFSGRLELNEVVKLLLNITNVRNGFDHGWTGAHIKGVPENIKETLAQGVTLFKNIVGDWDNIQSHFCENIQTNQDSTPC
jgi:CRISPR-associated Csx2 family protein